MVFLWLLELIIFHNKLNSVIISACRPVQSWQSLLTRLGLIKEWKWGFSCFSVVHSPCSGIGENVLDSKVGYVAKGVEHGDPW